jgi:DNA-binding CsgD family transcriptional regulator
MIRRSVLVGRDAERAGIEAALARCRDGSGGLVLVSGEAGVGKSRLVQEALAGWSSRRLRAAATAGGRSFSPLLELLQVRDDELDDAEVRDRLQRLADAGPTVIALEDLHWADAATLDLLSVLAAAWEDEPLLIVATYRSDQLPRTHPLRRVRTELRRAGRLTEFALRPLAGKETGDLLAGLLGGRPSARLVAAIHTRADGLPFFVEELAATLLESEALRQVDGVLDVAGDAPVPLPESVVDAVLARTEELRRAHPVAVELAAVFGVRVDLPVLATLVPPEDIDGLLDAGLLVEQGAGVATFRHALVRDALYGAISWGRRRGHHVRIARCLAEAGRPPETVAEHWIAAHEYRNARPLLLAAAERNCSLHAYRDAARLAERALDVWPEEDDPDGRIAALERLGECAELCDEHASAAATWSTLARLRHARGDVVGAGEANRRVATACELLGDWPRAVAARESAERAFTAVGAHGEAAEEQLALAARLRSAAHKSRALDYANAAATAAEVADRPDLRARALGLQGAIRAELGQGAPGVKLARQGLALAMGLPFPESAGEALYELASAMEYATDYAAAADTYESAFELCRKHDLTDLGQVCLACMSPVVRLMGDWDRGLSICAEVLGSDDSPPLLRMVAQEESGLIRALRGDGRRARGPLRRAAAFGRSHEVFGMEVGARWGLAMVADLDGDEAAVRREVAALLERYAGKEEWHYALPVLRWVSSCLGERGADEPGEWCHRLLATAATRNSSPKVLSTLAHAGGERSLADGHPAQAAGQFGRAVELLQGITAPYEKALSELRWGVALAADGDRQAAVDKVTSGYRTARQLGANPLARDCVAHLAAMGERVDERLGRLAARSLEPAGLTRRERQVLQLLSEGKTNRQIAADLFVSTRTVDMHVRNVLAKLGCSSRGAAVRRGVELGVLDRGGTAEVRQ